MREGDSLSQLLDPKGWLVLVRAGPLFVVNNLPRMCVLKLFRPDDGCF